MCNCPLEVKLPSVNILSLARQLEGLKQLRYGHSPFYLNVDPKNTQEELRIKLTRLERDLAPMDLGVMWDDSNEMYVVYDLDSRKVGE